MNREEGKEFANALKNNYTIDFEKIPDFCDLVISALSESEDVAYAQIMWERDTAIQQLKNLGYGFCEKPKDNKGELISRQAVEEINSEIPKIHELFDIAYEYNKKDSTRTELSQKCTTYLLDVWQTLGAIADNYSPAENKGEWIPISERLPEIHQYVLLSLRSLDVEVGFRAETEPYFYCHGADGCYIEPQNVLAWQPLPEPYQKEGE